MKPKTEFVLPLQKIGKQHAQRAGGKGANLGEMLRHGILVPPGYVVLSTAFDWFMQQTGIDDEVERQLGRIKHSDDRSIKRVSQVLRELIHRAPFPPEIAKTIFSVHTQLRAPLVAVRSSATAEDSTTASWAGELETSLFINKPHLLKSIQNCWSSLFTPRAIFYRFEKKLQRIPVSVAVVIQRMVASEISGITFTAHPVTKNRRQMVIEAGWGQGEAVVSGSITPDTYVIDRASNSILDITQSDQDTMIVRQGTHGTKKVTVPPARRQKQKLTGRQIMKIANLCATIEKHYGTPQDIEWAWARNKFYITQTRPITTL